VIMINNNKMAQPSGLISVADVMTAEGEQELLRLISENEWDTTLARRVQHYGHRYNYNYKNAGAEAALAAVKPIPEWAHTLFEKCAVAGGINVAPSSLQVIVNEYVPGQGISAHVDDPQQFGDWVITVSLGSACQMDFKKQKSEEKHSIMLPPRSAYIMTGESRYKWTHSIPARKSDLVDGKRVQRGKRVSVTFRAIKPKLH